MDHRLKGGYRIMKEMIKKYKGTLICSVLVMLAGIFGGFYDGAEHMDKRVFL